MPKESQIPLDPELGSASLLYIPGRCWIWFCMGGKEDIIILCLWLGVVDRSSSPVYQTLTLPISTAHLTKRKKGRRRWGGGGPAIVQYIQWLRCLKLDYCSWWVDLAQSNCLYFQWRWYQPLHLLFKLQRPRAGSCCADCQAIARLSQFPKHARNYSLSMPRCGKLPMAP